MNPQLQLQQQIEMLSRQGYDQHQIIEQLTGSGWDYSMVIGALTGKPVSASAGEKGSRKILFVLLATILLAVPAGLYLTRQQKQPEAAQTAAADTSQEKQQPKDIQTNIDEENYVLFNDMQDITFMVSRQWTGKTNRPQTTSVSLYNYDPEKVKAELVADDRFPEYANFYHDVKPRELETYPGSLDKMHEVHVSVWDMFTNEPLTQKSAGKIDDSGISDLQTYKVNENFVADYIKEEDEKSRDQRIIILRNPDGSKEVRITITPDASRDNVTKENFDGLMELVGSIQFRV
jgi:hypothetical protein